MGLAFCVVFFFYSCFGFLVLVSLFCGLLGGVGDREQCLVSLVWFLLLLFSVRERGQFYNSISVMLKQEVMSKAPTP